MDVKTSCPNGIMSIADARQVYELDREYYEVSRLRGMFRKEQITSYYIAINSWLLLVSDWSPRFAGFLKTRISNSGFRDTIAYCSSIADKLINNQHLAIAEIGPVSTLKNEVNAKILKHPRFCNDILIGLEVPPTILQLLRFPKRYCPPHAQKMVSLALEEFKDWDTKVEVQWEIGLDVFYRNFDGIIPRTLKYIAKRVFECIPMPSNLPYSITPGSTVDGSDTLLQKVLAILWDDPNFIYHNYSCPEHFLNTEKTSVISTSVIGAVPKSYKACRIIAPELCARQFKANSLAKLIDSAHKCSCVDIHDQSRNRELAKLGSLDGSYDTIDSSHASDSISKVFASFLIPDDLWNQIEGISFEKEYIASPRPDTRFSPILSAPKSGKPGLVPDYYELGGTERRLHALATAGNSLTFILESLIFATIGITAICLCEPERIDDDMDSFYSDLSVYGDDIVIRHQYVDTCLDLLRLCGITVNQDKTFSSPDLLYRESCGKEYFHGMDLTNVYLSRHPLSAPQLLGSRPKSTGVRKDTYTKENLDSLSMLVSLQHKLCDISPASSSFLKEVVQYLRPSMRCVPRGEADNSIWDDFTIPELVQEPYDFTKHPPMVKRVSCGMATSNPIVISDRESPILPLGPGVKPVGLKRLRKLISDGWTESQLVAVIECYLYEDFLKNGPKYSDPLMKLLGVSDKPRKDKTSYLYKDKIVWRDDGRVPVSEVIET